MVGRQPNAPASFTLGEIPGTHFQRLSRPQGTWFCRKEPRKKSQVTQPGIDPGTVRLVAQRLNHYATPGPWNNYILRNGRGSARSHYLENSLWKKLWSCRKTRRDDDDDDDDDDVRVPGKLRYKAILKDSNAFRPK